MCIQAADQFSQNCGSFLVASLILLTSCGVAKRSAPSVHQTSNPNQSYSVLEALNMAHQEWKGAPYVLGGSGINGVDCSSFVQIVFEDYFLKKLPRNTKQQLKVGNSVRRNYIRPGDLIFFRTGRSLLHVGVAMDGNRFLHASVSSGVMISRLDQRYWASRYLTTRRIL